MWKNGGNPYLSTFYGSEESPNGFPPFSHNRFENSFPAHPRLCPPGLFLKEFSTIPWKTLDLRLNIPANLRLTTLNSNPQHHHAEFSTFPQGLLSLFSFPKSPPNHTTLEQCQNLKCLNFPFTPVCVLETRYSFQDNFQDNFRDNFRDNFKFSQFSQCFGNDSKIIQLLRLHLG